MNKSCSEVYQSLMNCQSNENKRDWSKCSAIEKELEKCAVKSKLGELA